MNKNFNMFNDEQLVMAYLMIKAGFIDDPNNLNDDALYLIKDSLGDDRINEIIQHGKQTTQRIITTVCHRKRLR